MERRGRFIYPNTHNNPLTSFLSWPEGRKTTAYHIKNREWQVSNLIRREFDDFLLSDILEML